MITDNKELKKDLIIVLFLIVLSAFLRIPNYTKMAIMPDEILNSDYAYSILAYNWGWPPDQMYSQPPLLPYLLAIITYLFQGNIDIFRLVPITFGVLDVVVIYFLGKTIYDRKVGILAAIFLAFCSFHILYSKTLMLETTLIFFILASMYFFWKTYEENSIFYAVITGILVGLGDDLKYSALLMYTIFISYLLWIKRKGIWLDWKALFEKKFLIIIILSLLVFAPVVITFTLAGINPFYWQLFERYQTQFAGYKSASQFGLTDLLIHGFDNYIGLLIDATPDLSKGLYIDTGSIATMSLPGSWLLLFLLAADIILPVLILYYLYFTLKNQPRESFLFIAFLIFNVFAAIFGTRFQYYLLWNVPIFFIMLSYMTVSFAGKIRKKDFYKTSFLNKLTPVFIVLVGIFLVSYIYIGTLAPFVNEGIKVGYEKQILKVKGTLNNSDYIFTDRPDILYYYLNYYNMKNMQLVPLYEIVKDNGKRVRLVNLELLDQLKPKYIIVAIYSFSSYSKTNDKTTISENYDLLSNEDDVLLYERKPEQP
ncbi:Dolichyl-phosphate-mannose-protein mannosyltransferase [uncultured archaeon]|nr:Dolichyl-phosphate-mannose-protein mannosyltransferase [uncultured archaeon]